MLNLNAGGFQWTGEPVECYFSGLENGMSTFYKVFSYNGVNYQINDMILFKTALCTKLGKLLCVYESSANWHEQAKYRGVVKWFTKAADLPKIYLADINYDPDNEVVEDLRNADTNVSLQDAVQKCTLIYAHIDDPVYLVDDMKLDPTFYFSCRYRIKRNKLVPILSDASTTEILQLNALESTPRTYKAKLNDENKSNTTSAKKAAVKSVSVVLTPNRAKRNLNESFDFENTKSPVLNYSIVENVVDSDKPIRIKLKLSDVQKLEPCVLLGRIEGEVLEKKIEACVSDGENVFAKQPKVLIDRLKDECLQEMLSKHCEFKSTATKELTQDKTSKSLQDKKASKSPKKFKQEVDKSIECKSPKKFQQEIDISNSNEYKSPKKFKQEVDKSNECKSPKKSKQVVVDKSNGNELSDKITLEDKDEDVEFTKLNHMEDVGGNKNIYYANSDEGYVKILENNEVLNVSVDEIPLKDRLEIIREEEKSLRRSTRPKSRKSYVEFISPRKTRLRSTGSTERSDSIDTPTKKKPSVNQKVNEIEPLLKTPSKRMRTRSTSQETEMSPTKKLNQDSGRPKRNAGKPVKYKDDLLDLIIGEDSPDFKSKTLKNRHISHVMEADDVVKRVSPLKIQRTPGKSRLYQIADECPSPGLRSRSRKLSEDDPKTPSKLTTNSTRTPSRRQLTENSRTPSRRQLGENTKTPTKTEDNEHSHPALRKLRTRTISSDSAPSPRKSQETKISEDTAPSPRKSRDRKISEDSEVSSPKKRLLKDIYKTPKKAARESVAKTPKNTPSAKLKLIRQGVITPSMQCRKTAVVAQGTPLNKAREKLHVSYVPDALPCREREFADVLSFVQGKLLDGCGGCMYVSGVPGTGKTATVTEVIRNLQELSANGDVPDFTYVSINGMRLTEPRQSYVEILKQLTGKTVAWEQAQSMLEARFTKPSKKGKNPAVVMLVDELDILCTKRQDVVYNLLDWPTKATAQLIVITIANTMDLPERLLMGRVTSRLGLTRLTFQAYTHKQLQEIVMRRLMGTNAFNPDAIQLVARKVASVSGDARRALDICRRSAEIAEAEGPTTLVSMGHVNEALNAMITQPKVRAIKRCSRLEQLILQAVVAEVERTGVDETTFADVYTMLSSVAGIDGFPMVSVTLALAAVSRLGSSRLLLTDQKANDIHQRLILNVSPDDIYYALRKD